MHRTVDFVINIVNETVASLYFSYFNIYSVWIYLFLSENILVFCCWYVESNILILSDIVTAVEQSNKRRIKYDCGSSCFSTFYYILLKGAVMQIEKALITDHLRISKASWKFHIATIYNFAVIYPWNLLFS